MASSTTTKPTILLFSSHGTRLTGPYRNIGSLKKITDNATVLEAAYNKPNAPADLLRANPTARAIWITDPDIALPAHSALSQQIIAYVRNGGTAVLGDSFSSMIRPDDFDRWMRRAWGLPWLFGQYERTTVVFQSGTSGRSSESQHWRDGLPAAYSSKCVFLKNVAAGDSWYAAPEGAVSESMVFGSVPVRAQTSVAFAKVGNGWLGFAGDVNDEEGTGLATLAMMGLNVDAGKREPAVTPLTAVVAGWQQ